MEKSFDSENVRSLIRSIIDNVIENNSYQHNKVDQWSKLICEDTVSQLIKRDWPYKYIGQNSVCTFLNSHLIIVIHNIATCAIIERNGAGFHSSASCYWDINTDSDIVVRWENKSLHCIVQLFALLI